MDRMPKYEELIKYDLKTLEDKYGKTEKIMLNSKIIRKGEEYKSIVNKSDYVEYGLKFTDRFKEDINEIIESINFTSHDFCDKILLCEKLISIMIYAYIRDECKTGVEHIFYNEFCHEIRQTMKKILEDQVQNK